MCQHPLNYDSFANSPASTVEMPLPVGALNDCLTIDGVGAECQAGDVIVDQYEVKQVFQGGAMGLVYRVHHRVWDEDIAVKSPES